MTELLEKALEAVRKMPSETQDSIAEAMLGLVKIDSADGEAAVDIEPEHLAAVLEGLGQAERGEFATDEEVAAAFRRFER